MNTKKQINKNAEILNRVCSLNADENAFKMQFQMHYRYSSSSSST